MAPLLLLGGLVMASLPALLYRWGRRLPPQEWTRLCLTAMVVGAGVVELGAVLWLAPRALRIAGVGALASACERLLGSLEPFGTPGELLAGIIAGSMPLLAWISVRRSRSHAKMMSIERGLGDHTMCAGYELVELPSSVLLAYSVASPVPQVVISAGLRMALAPEQVDAVIAHEEAHLRHGHARLLRIAAAAGDALRWWPLSRRSARVLRAAVERWADDEATDGHSGRCRALREALVAVVVADPPPGVAAFNLAESTAERVEAIGTARRPGRLARIGLYVPGAAAGLFAVGVGITWLGQAQRVLAMAGRCPI